MNARFLGIVFVAVAALGSAVFIFGGQNDLHNMDHHHGADGTGHDEVNMPGLRGKNVSDEESNEMAVMFRNFQKIEREVTLLPNGYKSHTFSNDPELANILISHVVGMIDRVDEKNDPLVVIQSPTLDIIFERSEKISTILDVTNTGILVTQTSEDPELVKALQTHAAEVSDMANRGMQSVHERMKTSGSGH